jgi:thiol peroxidase
MDRIITLEKKPLTLIGRLLEPEQPAPGFRALSTDLQEVSLDSYTGKVKLITFFPSIDHPICDLQVREINRKAAALPEHVVVLGMSRDIPFALRRFIETFDIRHIELLSDQQYGSFGINYGVLIRELNLLTRGAVILDQNNILRYCQIVKELTNQPDFEDIFDHLTHVAGDSIPDSSATAAPIAAAHDKDSTPFSEESIRSRMEELPQWKLADGAKIIRQFRFRTFMDAVSFLHTISLIAEEQNHHPSFKLDYNLLTVSLTTHSAKGLTVKDITMAHIIDKL